VPLASGVAACWGLVSTTLRAPNDLKSPDMPCLELPFATNGPQVGALEQTDQPVSPEYDEQKTPEPVSPWGSDNEDQKMPKPVSPSDEDRKTPEPVWPESDEDRKTPESDEDRKTPESDDEEPVWTPRSNMSMSSFRKRAGRPTTPVSFAPTRPSQGAVEDEVGQLSGLFGEDLTRQKVAAMIKEHGKLGAEILVDKALIEVKEARLAELTSALPHLAYVTVMRAVASRPKRKSFPRAKSTSPKISCKHEAKRAKRE